MKTFRPYNSLLLCIILFPAFLSAQGMMKDARRMHRDSLIAKFNNPDTNYIKLYPDRFIVTFSQSYRQFDVNSFQTLTHDTLNLGSPKMVADANVSSGLSIDYDKISISFGLKTYPSTPDDIRKKGKTTYKAFSFSFGYYRFRFEASYRDYHGFYDLQTPKYDTSYKHTGIYAQNPSMDVRSVRIKTFFIFNKKKFSYGAAYFDTDRQMKSAGSLLLINNVYDYLFKSDTSLIPALSRADYLQYGNLNYFRVQGISIGPGYSYNLVLWKTLYANITLTSGFDFQHRTYSTSDGSYNSSFWRVGAAADARFAIGLNGKRCFASLTFLGDYNNYLSSGLRIEPEFKAVDFNFGYRFPFKERKWVKWMKANKIYQWL